MKPRESRPLWSWTITLLLWWGVTVHVSGQPASGPARAAEILARGQSIYVSLCQRCHGGDGDAVDYPGVVPLAGIDLRIPGARIADLSAPFVGRSFHGEEAEALVAYISRLRGAKGFARPGHLFSPYLLEKKLGETVHFRIVDVRPGSAYASGHIPNAVNWVHPRDSEHPPPEADLRRALSGLGVGSDTFVVIYDEAGGPRATDLWWKLQEMGLRKTAVLDGGWDGWQAFRGPATTRVPEFAAAELPEIERPIDRSRIPETDFQMQTLRLGTGESADFDWTRATGENGFLSAEEVAQVFEAAGIKAPAIFAVDVSPEETAFLLFLLVLTGSDPAWEAGSRRLFLQESSDRGKGAADHPGIERRINLPREGGGGERSVASGSSRIEVQ